MDRVQEIATAIAGLQPAEKRRLLEILAAQGDLPQRLAVPDATESDPVLTKSQTPQEPDYILIFDGGSKGNPGWGYGSYAITRTQDGAQRVEHLQLGDGYTNNEAEYDSLIAALEDLLERVAEADRQPQEFTVEVRGDSTLVIKQLQGTWQAREPRMRERRDHCRQMLERFGAARLRTQPREESVRVLGH